MNPFMPFSPSPSRPLAGGSVAVPSFVYRTGASSTANATSYTHADLSIGAVANRDYVLVCVQSSDNEDGLAATSVTIAGVAATLVRAQQGSFNTYQGWWVAAVPSGTTATVVTNYNTASSRNRVSVFTLKDVASLVPISPATFYNANSAANFSMPVTAPSGTSLIFASCVVGPAGSVNWINITERTDQTVESANTFSTAASIQEGAGVVSPEVDPVSTNAAGQYGMAFALQ